MLQNAIPLRKSALWPPNISDEHVSCTAPATRNASLQILCKCPTPAIVFGNATNPHVLLTFDRVSLEKTQCFATLLPFHAPASSVFWLFLFPVFVLLVFSSLTLPTSAFHLSILSEVWLLNFLRWICYIYIEVENQCCFIFLRCILGEIPASLLTEMLPSGRCLLGRHHSWALCWCWSTACSPRRRLREL